MFPQRASHGAREDDSGLAGGAAVPGPVPGSGRAAGPGGGRLGLGALRRLGSQQLAARGGERAGRAVPGHGAAAPQPLPRAAAGAAAARVGAGDAAGSGGGRAGSPGACVPRRGAPVRARRSLARRRRGPEKEDGGLVAGPALLRSPLAGAWPGRLGLAVGDRGRARDPWLATCGADARQLVSASSGERVTTLLTLESRGSNVRLSVKPAWGFLILLNY